MPDSATTPPSNTRLPNRHLGPLLLVIAGTLTLLTYLLGASYHELQRQAETDARNIAEILETRLEATLRRTQANLEELAREVPLEALDAPENEQFAAPVRHRLAARAARFPEISGYRVADAEGNVRFASDIAQPSASITDRSYFRALAADPTPRLFFSEVAIGRLLNRPQLHIATPITDDAGKFRGLVLAPLELNHLQAIFDAVDLGPNGVITFRRTDDGRLVLRRPERPNTVNQALANNPMHLRIERGDAAGVIRYVAAIDRQERVYAYKRVGDYPFYVAAGIAASDFLARWKRTALTASLTALLFLGGLAALALQLHRAEIREREAAGELRASEDRFQLLLHSVGEGIYGLDRDGSTTFSNPAAADMAGCANADELQRFDILANILACGPDERQLLPRKGVIRTAIADGKPTHGADAFLHRRDGTLVPVQYDVYPLVSDGEQGCAVLFLSDVTERRQHEDRIEFMANHDALTGLPNRLLAEDRFAQAAALANRTGSKVAILFVDLDGFKTINDSLGHDIGDRMLQGVAARLQKQLREVDTISRLGGDEFLIIMPGVLEVDDVLPVLGKLIGCLDRPFTLGPHRLTTSASVGVAIYPHDGEDFTTLMKRSDTAMYHAKDAGRNTYRLFDEAMNLHAHETLRLRTDLQRGIDCSEFLLYFQPQLDLRSGRIVGAEALVRWQDPQRGLIPPSHFIPVAESSGLIVPLGEWVLREACRAAARWPKIGGESIEVAINISAIQFKRGDIEETVLHALKQSGLPAQRLELELTESTLFHQTDAALDTLSRLHGMGVRLSIDDFGTGYSSLAYLKRLAVHKLKIDQSFIHDLDRDPDDAAIVRAIIDLARGLNLVTLAEGVEREAVLDALRHMGCDQIQGYFVSLPLSAEEFSAFLECKALDSPARPFDI